MTQDQTTGQTQYVVALDFSSEGAEKFATATSELVGKTISIWMDDVMISNATVKTAITDGKRLYRNETGNPGMATGGSGDVLAGMLVSLLGQGLAPLEAAAAAAWLHGAAGDRCAAERGEYGMTPSDLIDAASRLLP